MCPNLFTGRPDLFLDVRCLFAFGRRKDFPFAQQFSDKNLIYSEAVIKIFRISVQICIESSFQFYSIFRLFFKKKSGENVFSFNFEEIFFDAESNFAKKFYLQRSIHFLFANFYAESKIRFCFFARKSKNF